MLVSGMLVRNIMTSKVLTITVGASIQEAGALMKEHNIRHLPVVKGRSLIGLVTDQDVRGALIPAMIEDLSVKDVMTADPITVTPDTTIEDAARLIYRHKIGCLPVVDHHQHLKGIVTVVDMLGAMIELMGFISASSRLDLVLPQRPENLQDALRIVQRHGGRIIGISLTRTRRDQAVYLFRLQKIDLTPIVQDLTTAGFQVVSSLS